MRTHRFEVVSFVFGISLAGLGLAILQGGVDLWRIDWSWLWPIALVLSGVMVLASLRADRTADGQPQGAPAGADRDAFSDAHAAAWDAAATDSEAPAGADRDAS